MRVNMRRLSWLRTFSACLLLAATGCAGGGGGDDGAVDTCANDLDCDDGFDCTLDGCNVDMTCRHTALDARCDMGLYAQSGDPSLEDVYREECERIGVAPKDCMIPPDGLVMSAFVAEDPDRAWAELGAYMLHDAKMYAAWLGDSASATKNTATTVEALRADPGAFRIFTPDEAIDYVKANGLLVTQPLCGGIPPETAWASLHLIVDKVLPALA